MQAIQKKNYNYYMGMKMKSYSGEWVVICDGEIVSHGKDLKRVVESAKKKCGEKRFMLAKVPGNETMIY